MNINFLNNLVTELIVTKEDIIIALTEGEVEGWKRSMKKADLMEVLVNAIEEAEAEATNKEDIMNTEAIKAEAEVNVIDSNEAHVEAEAHVTSLEDEEETIRLTTVCDNMNAYDRACAFNRIYLGKKYVSLKNEEGNACASYKEYFKLRGNKVYGVAYAMGMHYVNLCKYVYPQREAFKLWNTRCLIALIKYMKKDETRAKVLEAIDSFDLNDSMTLEEVKEYLEGMFADAVETAEAEADAEADIEETADGMYENSNTYEVSDEAIDKAVNIMEAFLECNAHDSEVTSAWFTILKALDR